MVAGAEPLDMAKKLWQLSLGRSSPARWYRRCSLLPRGRIEKAAENIPHDEFFIKDAGD